MDANYAFQLVWLAGWLEGEGSFGLSRTSPIIQASTTNLEVAEHAAKILGVQTLGPYSYKRAKAHWKPKYMTVVYGDRAAEWMKALRPLMSSRRKTAIDRVLAVHG